MPTICLDLNGVIVDTPRALHALSCEIAGIHIPPERFAGKSMIGERFWNPACEAKKEFLEGHYAEAKNRFFEDRLAFLHYAYPVEGALEAVRHLHKAGCAIAVVTDVRSLPGVVLEEWFRRNKFPHFETIFTRGSEPKVDYGGCCDVVIDNDADKLIPFLDATSSRLLHFLPPQGTVGCNASRATSDDPRITQVRGWEEALPAILQEHRAAA